jgi:hypothetical protein
MTKGACLRNWSENGPTEAPGQRDRAADRGAEVADFQGLGNAAEWSRTITGVSTHKALNLARLPVPPQPLEGGRF